MLLLLPEEPDAETDEDDACWDGTGTGSDCSDSLGTTGTG